MRDTGVLGSAPARAVFAWLPLAVGLVAGVLASAPPAPSGPGAPADEFSAAMALEVLERLAGDETPHPVGSDANAAVRDRLLDEIRGLGLEPDIHESLACNLRYFVCGRVVNVTARLPGTTDGPTVVLTAHYDSAPVSPGVSDDLVGVTAVLEAARHLVAQGPSRNPVLLLFTDGEEVGLLGAEAFLDRPASQDVGVVVNVEARGTRGASMLFETSPDNEWLIRSFAAEAKRPITSSLLYEVYTLLPNDTDLSVYKAAGMSGVNFAYVGGLPHYHTPLDSLENLSLASLQHQGENVLAAARAFAAADLGDPPEGRAIFTTLTPGVVLTLPLSYALPLAVIGLGLIVAAFLLARRNGHVTVAGWALGFVAALVGVGFAGLIATGVTGLVSLIRPEAEPWYAFPLPARVAVWGSALLAVSLATVTVARTATRWGLALGSWTLWALLTLTVAIVLPGASAEMLAALVPSAALFTLAALVPARPFAIGTAAFVSAALAAYFWLPLALDLESGLGLGFAGPIAAIVGLVATTSTALLAGVRPYRRMPADLPTATLSPSQPPRPAAAVGSPSRRGRAALVSAVAAGAAAVVGIAVSFAVPAYTELWPRRISLLYQQEWHDGEIGAARWLVEAQPGGPLPEALAALADWREPVSILPWPSPRYWAAQAPTDQTPPPTAEIVSDETVDGERRLTVRLRTSAVPLRTVIQVPAGVGLAEARFVGSSAAWDFRRATGLRDRVINCYGPTCDGQAVTLVLTGTGPVELAVAEVIPGLPESAGSLLAARPGTAVPSHDGDVSVRINTLTIP